MPPDTKDYILTLLFLKYVSDRAESDPEPRSTCPKAASSPTCSHAKLADASRRP